MQKQYRNVLVLSGCQATLQITGATMIAVTGLAGFALAEDKSLKSAYGRPYRAPGVKAGPIVGDAPELGQRTGSSAR